jgi:hypothetical protein
MATVFSKIIKGILVGAGSILSIIPGLKPLGAAAIAGGLSISAKGTIDAVSNSSSIVGASLMGISATGTSKPTLTQVWAWIVANWYIPVLIIGGFILFKSKLFKRRRK